jgi:cell division protein FtsI (penicillin-binding protein 3)
LLCVLGLALGAVVVRLAQVQLLSAPREAAYGRSEVLHTVSLPAQRGSILDLDGEALAISVPATTIDADPFQIKHPDKEAAALAPILGVPVSTLAAELHTHSGFVYLAKQLAPPTADKVEALGLPGIYELSDPKRVDPDGSLLSQLIGTVGTNGGGLDGLEYQYNSLLGGRSGQETLEEDPEGGPIPGGVTDQTPSRPGQGLVLTIDPALEYQAEQALSTEVVQSHAKGGTVIVSDPRNGDILATVSLQASPSGGPPVATSQPAAFTDVYEPGSVMKLADMAGALTDGLITPSTEVTVPGQLLVAGTYFHDDTSHPTEELTPGQILSRSSNIGAIKVAELLGKQRLYDWLRAFGFGKPTGLSYPGESDGLLPVPSQWSGTDIGTMPIGQGEAATPLQVLDAYNVIANDGVFVPPRIVSATVDPEGQRHALPLAPRRRVISEKVAGELTTMLEGVVQSGDLGTAPTAAIPGYTVAGKTGTAEIPWPNRPGYEPGAYEATFVGFVPAQRPAVSILVNLDQPTPIYGGSVAAPVFAELAQYVLHTMDIASAGAPPPGTTGNQDTVPFDTPTTTPSKTTTTTTPSTTTTTTPSTTTTTTPTTTTPTTTTPTTTTPTTTAATTTAAHATSGLTGTTDPSSKARPATLAGSARAPNSA